MNIKLIAFDLDKTVLTSNSDVSCRTKEALEKASEKGIFIVPVTGRVISEIPKCVTDIKGIKYAISSNGASITDFIKNKPIYKNELSFEKTKKIINVLKKFDNFTEVYYNGRPYSSHTQCLSLEKYGFSAEALEHFRKTTIHTDDIYDFVLSNNISPEKFYITPATKEIRKKIKETLEKEKDIIVTSSNESNFEINNKGAEKGVAILKLCHILNISIESVMTIGDNDNDISMLSLPCFSVAMGNANDKIKNLCRYVTLSNDEDGVSYVLEKFVL